MEFEFIEYKEGTKYAKRGGLLSKSPQSFNDCGIRFDGSFSVVDFDNVDKSLAENICQYFKINTMIVYTDRGFHIYFKKPSKALPSRYICKLGIEVEFKHKGSITYKRNGIVRETTNYGVLAELPDCLKQLKRVEPLLNLDEGDGRNQKLFKYNGKITLEQARFINKFIFASPLPEQELETILRKQTNFISDEDKDKPTRYLAREFVSKFNLCVHNGTIFYKKPNSKSNLYHVFTATKENMNIDGLKFVQEVDTICSEKGLPEGKNIKFFRDVLEMTIEEARANKVKESGMIALRNGYLVKGNDGKLEFVELLDDTFCEVQFDIDYKPNTNCQDIDDFISWTEHEELLYQFLGNLVEPDFNARRKGNQVLVLYGNGQNGKSVFLDCVKALLSNEELYSTATIQHLDDERNIGVLGGKVAWLGEELGSNAWSGSRFDRIKKIVTGEQMDYSPKYGGSRTIRVAPTIIFTTNHLDYSAEKGKAFERRVVFCHFKKQPAKIDINLTSKLTTSDAINRLLDIAIEAYNSSVIDGHRNRSYKLNEHESEFMDNYTQKNNPLKHFFTENIKSLVGLNINVIRDKFLEYLDDEIGYETARTGKEMRGYKKKIENYILDNYDCKIGSDVFLPRDVDIILPEIDVIKQAISEKTFFNKHACMSYICRTYNLSSGIAETILESGQPVAIVSDGKKKIGYVF